MRSDRPPRAHLRGEQLECFLERTIHLQSLADRRNSALHPHWLLLRGNYCSRRRIGKIGRRVATSAASRVAAPPLAAIVKTPTASGTSGRSYDGEASVGA